MPKISELPTTNFPSLDSDLPTSRDGETVKITGRQLRNLMLFAANEIAYKLDVSVEQALTELANTKADAAEVASEINNLTAFVNDKLDDLSGLSPAQAAAIGLKLDKTGQAADSARLGSETAAQWMDRITAGAYTPPTTSTLPVGSVALCVLGNNAATSNNGATISGGQLRLAGMPSTMNIVDIQASSKVGVGGWQTGTWKNIHGENIGGSPGALQFRSGYFVRTL